ncbi:MAG: hypothetical protein R3B48_03905 [Kofleriaceae bacterium]
MLGDLDAAYRELLGELFAARRAGVVFGLERMREILARLGHPERRLGAIVHVAGTNGKGSTAAMIRAMARAHGRRVGQYTSPHLCCVRERIVDDDGWVDRARFVDAAAEVRAAGGAALTFFEQLTAIALVALARRPLDLTVLEVGLGGRLDATNVVEGALAVVTGVALDHEAMLGPTLGEIAAEKAGIFRRGQPAILGLGGEPEAVPELLRLARAAGATPIEVVTAEALAEVPPLALRGAYQRRNAATALAAVRALVRAGVLPDDEAARRRGLLDVVHPGRLELVAATPRVLLDGAHNPAGAVALAAELPALPAPRVLILAVSADKDAAAIARPLLPHVSLVIATAYQQERSLPAGRLAQVVREAVARASDRDGGGDGAAVPAVPEVPEVIEAPDLVTALGRARALLGASASVVIAGSLFLVGEARAHLLDVEVDPLPLSDPSARR